MWVQQKAGDSSHCSSDSHAPLQFRYHTWHWGNLRQSWIRIRILMMLTVHLLWTLPPSKDLCKSRRPFNTQHQPFYRSLFSLVLKHTFPCCNKHTEINRTWSPQHLWIPRKSRDELTTYPSQVLTTFILKTAISVTKLPHVLWSFNNLWSALGKFFGLKLRGGQEGLLLLCQLYSEERGSGKLPANTYDGLMMG